MNFEDLENAWSAQRPMSDHIPDLAELKQKLIPELKRRNRFFAYEFFCLIFGLAVIPLLAIVNSLYSPPDNLSLYWIRVVLVLVVLLGGLFNTTQRFRRHRALAKAGTDTILAFATRSLANVEAEIKDYRAARWGLAIGLGLTLFSIYVNQPITKFGWAPFSVRAGLVLAFGVVVGAVLWRHYRRNLVPECARRKEMVQQLS